MNTFKRITATLLALLTVGSITAFAGCKKEPTPSTDSSAMGECTTKGHDYGNTGVCVRCEEKAVLPSLPSSQKFPLVEVCTHKAPCPVCDYIGTGEDMWNRLELKEGCFTVEISKTGKLWLSFPVEQAGQYVLHSVSGANGVTAARHAANDSYVNEKGIDAVVEKENFYAYDNCGEKYYNANWRSTYCLTGTAGTQIKIRFIRIADPAWEPEAVHTTVYATELAEKAQDMPSDKALFDVPYNTPYFFDESVGYYRMGTTEAPGEIIYAAINKEATRLFNEGMSFRNIRQSSTTSLNLNDGLTENGDYNVLCYTPFIMNWTDENAVWYGENNYGFDTTEPAGDTTKKCYQNYCNSDGVYPVNQELHKFLTLYTKLNKPVDEEITSELWQSGEADGYLWLSACYYYGQRATGTKENPHLLTENGDNDVSTKDLDYFFKVNGTGSYTLRCETAGVYIKITSQDGTSQQGVALTEITVNGTDVFELYTMEGNEISITLTVTKN